MKVESWAPKMKGKLEEVTGQGEEVEGYDDEVKTRRSKV